MPVIQTKTTYLQMFAPPADVIAEPRSDLRLRHAANPSLDHYRLWYRGVGSAWNWVDRLRMADGRLQSILGDPRVEVWLLEAGSETAGFAELDRREPEQVELAYFGLYPAFVGRGLGKYFLNRMLWKAWSDDPRRVWVHTCDLDHPAALPNYQKAGLEVYEERLVEQFVPGDSDPPAAG